MSNIKRITPVGVRQTYDLEVAHPDHQFFLSNGVLTSNSHAVSYAIDSYYCAYLLNHFPDAWLCAYLETMSENDKKRAKAMGELRTFGYKIVDVDVNYATDKWTIMPNKEFMPSFLTIKGIGRSAIEEVVRMRPFTSVEDMLFHDGAWRFSKFNKRALEALIKIGGFDSLNAVGPEGTFENYRQMYEVVIARNADIKKTKGRGIANFRTLVDEVKGLEDWTREEKVVNYRHYVGHVSLDLLVDPAIREKLQAHDVFSIDDFGEDITEDVAWFIVEDVKLRLSKNKKQYLLINAVGEFGKKHRVFCWGAKEEDVERFKQNSTVLGQLKKWDGGFSAQAWKLRFVEA